VGYHRFLRDRGTITSMLTRVKGIGPRRLRNLLRRFNSIREIQEAPLEDLASVPGFPKELAHQLFEIFHPADPAP
jgi:excinuclease ABC subunit C